MSSRGWALHAWIKSRPQRALMARFYWGVYVSAPVRWWWSAWWPAVLLGALLLLPLAFAWLSTMTPLRRVNPGLVAPSLVLAVAASLALTAALWRVSGPLALVWTWAVLRTVWSGVQVPSLVVLLWLLAGLVLYLLLFHAPTDVEASMLGMWPWALLVVGAFGVLDVLRIVPMVTGPTGAPAPLWTARLAGQPHGLFDHPNDFAAFFALGLAPLLVWCSSGRWPRWLVVAPWAGLLVLSQTRAIYLALVFVGLVWLACRWGPLNIPDDWWLVGGVALFALAGAVSVGGELARADQYTLGGRAVPWALALVAWWQENQWIGGFWIGGGLGAWEFWSQHPLGPLAQGVPWIPGMIGQGAHTAWYREAYSEVVQTGFELGVIGLTLGLAVLAQALRDAWEAWDENGPAGPFWAWAGVVMIAAPLLFFHPILHRPALVLVLLIAAARLRRARCLSEA